MSYTSLGQRGVALVEEKRFAEAIPMLTKAIESAQSPAWLIALSKARVGVKEYDQALDEADAAFLAAQSRGNRVMMIEAQYRRAVAFLRLGQLANADSASVWSMDLCEGRPLAEPDPIHERVDLAGLYTVTSEDAIKASNKTAAENRLSIGRAMADTPEKRAWNRASCFRVPVLARIDVLREKQNSEPGQAYPELRVTAHKIPVPLKESGRLRRSTPLVMAGTATEEKTLPTGAAAADKGDRKIKIVDFQSSTSITVTLFSKGVDQDKLSVRFQSKSVYLDPINYPDGSAGPFFLQLWNAIDPDKCQFMTTASKVELTMQKATAGKWPQIHALGSTPGLGSLPHAETSCTPQSSVGMDGAAEFAMPTQPKQSEAATAAATGMAASGMATSGDGAGDVLGQDPNLYPTSASSGAKDWDKVLASADDDEDDEASLDVNYFFRKLYKSATPEQRRAMLKSYTESNGTSLSTNWDDVKDRTMHTNPPDGVEAKRWEQ